MPLAIPRSRNSNERYRSFCYFVEGGCQVDEFQGFKVVNRVVNLEVDNGWAILESSSHQNILEWESPWTHNFGVYVEFTTVLTDQEFISVHKEIASA